MSARPAATVSGTQTTNAVGRDRSRRPAPSSDDSAAAVAADAARNQRDQRDRQRPATAAPRPAPPVSTERGDDGAARRLQPLRARQHAARGQPPGTVRRHHDLVQPAAGQVAERRDARRSTRGDGRDRHAGDHPRQLPGTAQAFQQSLGNEPLLIAGRAGRRLHRARRALRELHPPDHHPLDPALGRRRRGAGAADRSTPSSASSR